MKLNKYLKGGGSGVKVIVEKGEYVKTTDGEVFKVGRDMPTHDDTVIVDGKNNRKVSKGKGGVELENIDKVVSATTENRRKKDKSHTEVDEALRFQKEEAKDFIKQNFGLNAKVGKSVSPAGIIDATINRRDQFTKKFNKIQYRTYTPQGRASLSANKATLATLPELDEIFERVFDEQEIRKIGLDSEESTFAQTGGSVGKKSLLSGYVKAQTGRGRRVVPSPQDLGVITTSDRGSIQPVRNAIKDQATVKAYKEKEALENAIERRASASLSEPKRQPLLSKSLETVLHPFTSLGYVAREGRLPDYFTRNEDQINYMDYAASAALPARYAFSQAAAEISSDVLDNNFTAGSLLGLLGTKLPFGKTVKTSAQKFVKKFNSNYKKQDFTKDKELINNWVDSKPDHELIKIWLNLNHNKSSNSYYGEMLRKQGNELLDQVNMSRLEGQFKPTIIERLLGIDDSKELAANAMNRAREAINNNAYIAAAKVSELPNPNSPRFQEIMRDFMKKYDISINSQNAHYTPIHNQINIGSSYLDPETGLFDLPVLSHEIGHVFQNAGYNLPIDRELLALQRKYNPMNEIPEDLNDPLRYLNRNYDVSDKDYRKGINNKATWLDTKIPGGYLEPSPMAREYRQEMINEGIINSPDDIITVDHLKKAKEIFTQKPNVDDDGVYRFSKIFPEESFSELSGILNRLHTQAGVVGAAGVTAAAAASSSKEEKQQTGGRVSKEYLKKRPKEKKYNFNKKLN